MADEKQPEAQKIAIAMTRALIQQVKDEEGQRSESRLTRRAKVKKHHLFDVNDHVELDRQRKEKEEAYAAAKEEKMAEDERKRKEREYKKEQKEKKRRAMYCNDYGKRWAKKLKEVWKGCEHCDFFWFCAECKNNHVDDIREHEDNHEIEDDEDGDEEVESDDDIDEWVSPSNNRINCWLFIHLIVHTQ